MNYKGISINFMTGTGNSYRVATWLVEEASKRGIIPLLSQVKQGCKKVEFPGGPDYLLALIAPTHGFTAPWYMIRFTLNLPNSKGTHAIILPTRAGTKIGSFFLPGMQGTCGYLLALILLLKGYTIRGVLGIDMPSNWTALHWGINRANSKAIIVRAKKKTASFIKSVLSGATYFGGFIELILGLLLLPVSLVYLLYGRFNLAKLFFANESCDGCGLCIRSCLTGAIKMRGTKPYWTFSCESCMRCMNFCPSKSIEVSYPLAFLMGYVTAIPVANNLLKSRFPEIHQIGFFNFILQYTYFLVSIFSVYYIFSILNRIPIISKIFGITTLTHYYRRYHEPDTKLKDIA